MALSITKISKWLKKNKLAVIKHELDKAENTITFLTSDSEGTEAHIIRIRENGELFEWKMHLILEKEGETHLKDGEIPENEQKTLFKMLAKYMQQHQDEVINTTVES